MKQAVNRTTKRTCECDFREKHITEYNGNIVNGNKSEESNKVIALTVGRDL